MTQHSKLVALFIYSNISKYCHHQPLEDTLNWKLSMRGAFSDIHIYRVFPTLATDLFMLHSVKLEYSSLILISRLLQCKVTD